LTAGQTYCSSSLWLFESIIAKRKDSCYEIGKRSGGWLKYKVNQAQEFVIAGYTPDN
jgi:bifunctional non-homologous end joining protein LigD